MQIQANTALSWPEFLGSVRQLGLDFARFKLIDSERLADDNNVPDQADLRYSTLSQTAGGLTIGAWLMVAVVALGTVLVIRQFTK